ncbi:exonuclease domain-containing protein [Paenibacillus sp. YPG26]|uniref:exonuclease domain-containing protein n=1 Tax=Paenibacillus sp. YPG26 TaxID=2878915 RepID=UPI0020419D27|nr:exonuclease domain-containing protein [Paenibacillus sp. YPG26]USB32223.1 3'-5' exoribonuclease [Paenibacillus sp. YPG26]
MREPVKKGGGFWDALKTRTVPASLASMTGDPSAQQIAFIRSLTKGQRRPETLHIPLAELKTAVFDLETSGFHTRYGDEIISFGAVKMEGGQITNETYYALSKCSGQIPESVIELTGITQEMSDQAPPLVESLHGFMTFIDDRVLIAHGSAHDKSFLDHALWRTTKTHLGHRVLDTMMIAGKLEPHRGITSLDDWLDVHGIEITMRHHALHDSRMTAALWAALIPRLRQNKVSTLGDLYVFLSQA